MIQAPTSSKPAATPTAASPVGVVPPTVVSSVRSQRRPLFAVVAVLLILLGAAGGALVFWSTGSTVDAVAARVPITRGTLLTADLFATVQIAPNEQLAYIEADQLDQLVGLRAAHDVAAGALVDPGLGTAEMVPSAGRTVVGLSLPPGAEPAVELLVGDKVRVVLTEPVYACTADTTGADGTTASSACTGDLVVAGVVAATARDEASGQLTVSVDVAEADAPRTAAAAALGRAALVLDSREQ